MPGILSKDLAPASAEAKDTAAKIASSGSTADKAVRDAATALRKAIADAREAGFVVDFRDDVLDRIPISATAKALG